METHTSFMDILGFPGFDVFCYLILYNKCGFCLCAAPTNIAANRKTNHAVIGVNKVSDFTSTNYESTNYELG